MAIPVYLRDHDKVLEVKQTKTPHYTTQSGYGGKLPTSRMVRTEKGKHRWYRIYVMIYSNSGSAYIVKKGQIYFLDDFDLPN